MNPTQQRALTDTAIGAGGGAVIGAMGGTARLGAGASLDDEPAVPAIAFLDPRVQKPMLQVAQPHNLERPLTLWTHRL